MGASARTAAELGGISLRRATASDVDVLAALEREAFTDPWSRHALALAACAHDTVCTVAEEECADARIVVGYSILRRAADECELLNLAVAGSRRGRGVGTVLVERALADAAAQAARAIFLEVRVSNAPARALYSAAGFETVGRRRDYYRRPTEDALILRKVLI